MTDYSNGKNVLLKRPEPGRPIKPVLPKKEAQQNINVDTNAIADAVIKAITNRMPQGKGNISLGNITDSFDNSESLQKLADAMSVNEQGDSNLEGLGKIKETKKDQKEVDKAIDMLSKLGD